LGNNALGSTVLTSYLEKVLSESVIEAIREERKCATVVGQVYKHPPTINSNALVGTVQEIPDRERATIKSKRMPTIVWGPTKFSVAIFQKLIIHADHARRHKAEILQLFSAQTGMRMATHTPYSPDLAPSDFYLFGHMKGPLRGESFETGEDLLSAIQVIAGWFEKSVLSKAFSSG
jgi:hypothetical protein